MTRDEFLSERAQLRQTRPGLVDLSELNLYRSLAKLDGARFGSIAPSTHEEAPYRCHLAERFLSHLGLSQQLKSRTHVSHGIRRSLRALFAHLASAHATVGVPDDVYPVYGQLAAEAGVKVAPWSAREGLPKDLSGLSALLVCEPLKPWGTSLASVEVERLRSWARADERRMVIIDSAYATPPSPLALQAMLDESAVLLVSLSKGWLIPDHAGLCIVPTRFQQATRQVFAPLPKDTERLRIGYAALTEHADRVGHVTQTLAHLASRLDDFTSRRPEFAATRCAGYFAATERSFSQLLELGVLAVPASIFGGSSQGCILSSLPVA